MAEYNLSHFRNLWQKNMVDLEHHCEEWEKISNDNSMPDDVKGEIRTAIGLARLLMNQKLKQFKGLIDDSEFNTGEKPITYTDLEGFWDMVYYEIEKIKKSFTRLNASKNNDWKFEEETSAKYAKKIPIKKDISAINNKKEISKAQVLAARQRIAELKKKMAAAHKENKDENQIDILLPNKKGLVENIDLVSVSNIALSNDKTLVKESNEQRKFNHKSSSKKNMQTENNALLEESSRLNSASKLKSAQKKKLTTSNKENVCLDNDSSDSKHTPAKQAKFNEPTIKKPEKSIKDFVKLQCVTRSASKRALLLQQSLLQK